MTAQSNTSSPFQNKNDQATTAPATEFSIRTMQDDLASLQKNGIVAVEKKSEPTPIETPIKPTPEPIKIIAPTAPQKEELPPLAPGANPFLDQETVMPSSLPVNKMPSVQGTQKKETPLVEIPSPKKPTGNSSSIAYKIALTFVSVLILAVLGLGGYYFWMTKSNTKPVAMEPTTETPAIETPIQPEETPIIIEAPIEKYSANKPNYLTLDINALGLDDIKKIVATTATEIKTMELKSTYEFIPVDANNTPISFPIFAIATKLNLSSTVLKNLGNNFSLYIYNDNGDMRLGLSVEATNTSILSKDLLLQEKSFPLVVDFLFLGNKPGTTYGLFDFSDYNGAKIRFLNVNKESNLSIDYTVFNSHLLIGTSKNTLRAVIDKVSGQVQSSTPALSTTGQLSTSNTDATLIQEQSTTPENN